MEQQNSVLEGVLNDIDFNSNKLGDTKHRDIILQKLINHFSSIGLKNADLSDPDMLGRAYATD